MKLFKHIALSTFVSLAVTANQITLSAPLPFSEADIVREIKSILPTTMSTIELDQIAAELRERALFSARVTNAEFIQELDDVLRKYGTGESDLATVRLQLKQKLDELGYQADAEESGKITDLRSDARLNVRLRTNMQMASGYGQWVQGQNPVLLNSRPAQELYRAFNRRVPRNWIQRWRDAGGKFYRGKMIALKDDPIWIRISRFRNPYPPFDFNSGMSVRDVDRQTAVDLGLIDMNTQIKPQDRGFNDDLQVTPDVRDASLRKVLESEGYSFDNGVLTL